MTNGEIFFLSVRSSDEGVYQCIAENSLGEAKSRNATLRVACEFACFVFIFIFIYYISELHVLHNFIGLS